MKVIENEKMVFHEETELRLGLPSGNTTAAKEGDVAVRKRGFSEAEAETTVDLMLNLSSKKEPTCGVDPIHKPNTLLNQKTLLPPHPAKPPAKAQVVGWPPVRWFRKNMVGVVQKSEGGEDRSEKSNGRLVKVSMDGAPYLRKVDLKMYKSYQHLSDSLGNMFRSFTIAGNCGSQGIMMNESKLMDILNGSDFVPTYEDKDGDWMLVGDVPWEMFVESCKRLRIMKGKEAIGLAPRAMEKCKKRS